MRECAIVVAGAFCCRAVQWRPYPTRTAKGGRAMATTTNNSQQQDSAAAHAPADAQLPILGAAMMLADVPHYLEWLADDARPLELQDPFIPDVLDGTWREVARN